MKNKINQKNLHKLIFVSPAMTTATIFFLINNLFTSLLLFTGMRFRFWWIGTSEKISFFVDRKINKDKQGDSC